MRLYLLVPLTLLFVVGCSPATQAEQIAVSIEVDGDSHQLTVPIGTLVGEAMAIAGIELGELDEIEPSVFVELVEGEQIRVIRVREEFEVEQVPLLFESRTLRNESLPAGEQRLVQNGINGLEEITYRLVYEDEELVSRVRVNSTIITAPVEEIIMIGAELPFSSVGIEGRLAFLSGGNAWLLEGSSGARRAIVITGDLDGRVFEISPNGEWLLFTRHSDKDDEINGLWVASLDEETELQIDLRARNIVHFAGWVQDDTRLQVAFSTVEPVENPPGWKANNDLQFVSFTSTGEVSTARLILTAREDGFYAWWGTSYAISGNGLLVAFARPDAVGLVDAGGNQLDTLIGLTTYQTSSDWAWMPSLSWSPDGQFIYTVDHVQQDGLAIQEQSPVFDVIAVSLDGEVQAIAEDAGMFAAPQASSSFADAFFVAFLRAFTSAQSDISAYELIVAGSDGSNPQSLFPPEGSSGLQPQKVAWSPVDEGGNVFIAFIYQGNLWVVGLDNGESHQLTGDGLVSAVSWR